VEAATIGGLLNPYSNSARSNAHFTLKHVGDHSAHGGRAWLLEKLSQTQVCCLTEFGTSHLSAQCWTF